MFEDQLPEDMPREDYDQWYAQSWLSDGNIGVRVGPQYPFAEANEMKHDEPEITRIPKQFCPNCGKQLDATMEATEGQGVPEPGNYMVCGGCGVVMIWDDDLRFRPLTVEEAEALAHDKEGQQQIIEAVRRVHEMNARLN